MLLPEDRGAYKRPGAPALGSPSFLSLHMIAPLSGGCTGIRRRGEEQGEEDPNVRFSASVAPNRYVIADSRCSSGSEATTETAVVHCASKNCRLPRVSNKRKRNRHLGPGVATYKFPPVPL